MNKILQGIFGPIRRRKISKYFIKKTFKKYLKVGKTEKKEK